jgi:hypothetical protein
MGPVPPTIGARSRAARRSLSDCHCPSSRSSFRESSSPRWPAGSPFSADALGRPGSRSASPSARSPSHSCWRHRPDVAHRAELEREVGRDAARDAASNSGADGPGRRSMSLMGRRRSPRLRLSRARVVFGISLQSEPRPIQATVPRPRSGGGLFPSRLRRLPDPVPPSRSSAAGSSWAATRHSRSGAAIYSPG